MSRLNRTLLARWQPYRRFDTPELVETRLQLHYAAQLVAALGKYLLPERPDDSHTSLQWSVDHAALVGELFGPSRNLRGGLRIADLTLLLIDVENKAVEELPLNEKKRGEALSWMRKRLEAKKVDAQSLSLAMHYEIPFHPVKDQQPFRIKKGQYFEEMSHYFGNSDLILQEVVRTASEASVVRCWPHHFDIATLLTLTPSSDPEKARTVGIGLSPGDGTYPMPYYYVTPWPYPEVKKVRLPELAGKGRWHTGSWVGAVLTADRIVIKEEVKAQLSQTWNFIQSAQAAARELLS